MCFPVLRSSRNNLRGLWRGYLKYFITTPLRLMPKTNINGMVYENKYRTTDRICSPFLYVPEKISPNEHIYTRRTPILLTPDAPGIKVPLPERPIAFRATGGGNRETTELAPVEGIREVEGMVTGAVPAVYPNFEA